MMALTLIHSRRFAEHRTPPGHPERVERAEVMSVVAAEWRERGGELVEPRPATRAHLERVHDPAYLDRIESTAGHAVALDADTYTSPESHEIALLGAGAAVDAIDRLVDDESSRVVALVRPPGHHAERDRAMGFCLYNNAAVAAAHARARGMERVAIVDYDVHHGNGTQHIFEDDPHVLYVSLHQFPFYPGTGSADEIGIGAGAGRTVNVPLESGAVDEDYNRVFGEVVMPVLRQFRPTLLVISAGLDAHERDPLASMRLSTQAFAAMTAELRLIADESCGGRLALLTEGGYDLRALAESLRVVIDALEPDAATPPVWPWSVASSRGREAVRRAQKALGAFWAFPAASER
jgi:acetoin utilization deacetylase AcuC-like enzyme